MSDRIPSSGTGAKPTESNAGLGVLAVVAGLVSALALAALAPISAFSSPIAVAHVQAVAAASPIPGTPPTLIVSAAATTNATSPAGAIVSFLAVTTDDIAPASIGCSPASGSVFKAGTTTVTCTARDVDDGLITIATFTITVSGATDQIARLSAVVVRLHLQSGIADSLLSKLRDATKSANKGNLGAACRKVDAFADEIETQAGKKVPAAVVPALLQSASEIQAALGCESSSAPPVLLPPATNITVHAAPGTATARVLFTETSVGPVTVACVPVSGTAFPLGTTTVNCTATQTGEDQQSGQNQTADPKPLITKTSFTVTVDLVLTGRVTDRATGMPIADALVRVFQASAPFQAPQFLVSSVTTDTNGLYSAVLPGGKYKVLFGGDLVYVAQWWNDTPTLETADVLDMSVSLASINASLVRGFLIHGRVTDAVSHVGIKGIDVGAVDSSVSCCPFRNLGFGQTDATGDYQLLVPPHSSVKVQFFAFPSGTPPYVDQWWNNKPFFEQADPLAVNAETFAIDAMLLRGTFVHGRVTDSVSGAGIQGISIGAVDSAVQCCPFHNLAFTQSNTDGTYNLFVPIGSTFKVQFGSFGPNALPYLQQWWNNKADFSIADPLTAVAETFNINAALVRGFFVHGQVADSLTHVGIQGINVSAVGTSVPCCPFNNLGFAQTDSAGKYQVLVPPGSTIKLQFNTFGPNAPPYLEQWWNNKPDFGAADPLLIDKETFGINVAMVRGVVIHGQVTDAVTHLGIPRIDVGAVDPAVHCCPFRGISNNQTDAGGNYSLVVPNGSPFKLQFFQFPIAKPAYLGQWWKGKGDFEVADPITVTQDSFGFDAALVPGVLISGHVTGQASRLPLEGIGANATDPSGRFVGGSPTDVNGNYTMVVPAGSYKVLFAIFNPTPNGLPYLRQWWNGKPDFASADLLDATADRSGVDAAMVLGVFIHGHVTDAVTGAGIARIDVDASDSTLPCCSSLGFTQTDSSGDYRLAVKAGSTVRLHMFAFGPGSPQYIDVWWQNSRFFETADTLTVNGETFGIDAALAPGVLIHGQVTDKATNAGIAGINVHVVEPNVPCCPFGELSGTQTDANGNYTLLVPRGRPFKLRLFSSPGNPPYIEQWWNNKPTFNAADALTVKVETSGINAALVPG